MKILHTSDWHLGRTLHGVDLSEATEAFLADLVSLTQKQQPDALLISGDLFDRPNPPLSAVKMLRQTLNRLCEETRVIITPGNHDSSTRLGFTSDFLRDNLVIRTDMENLDQPVLVCDQDGEELAVYPIPYLQVASARQKLCPNPEDPEQFLPNNPQAVMRAALRRVHTDLQKRRQENPKLLAVAMIHAFVTGGTGSDSELSLSVGGIEMVPTQDFATLGGADPNTECPLNYIAAGHLHQAQTITKTTPVIRYCGSPLAFSFSEAKHKKSVTLVDFQQGQPHYTAYPTPVHRPLRVIHDTIESLEKGDYQDSKDHYVSVHITNAVFPSDMRSRVRKLFPHLLHVVHEPPEESTTATQTKVVTKQDDPVKVCHRFFMEVGGLELTTAQEKLLDDIIDEVRTREEE